MGLSKSNYDYFKSRNRCVQCGQMDAYTLNGRAYCAECAEWRRNYYRDRAKKPEIKEAYNAYRLRLCQGRKENGLCPYCGRKVDAPYVLCARCRMKSREKYRNSHPLPAWPESLCSRCHKRPCVDGKKLCEQCYQSALISASKATEAVRGRKRAEA